MERDGGSSPQVRRGTASISRRSYRQPLERLLGGPASWAVNMTHAVYWHASTPMEKAVVNQLRGFFTEISFFTVIHNSIHCGLTLGRLWIRSKPL